MTTTTTASWYMIHTKKLMERRVTRIMEKKKIPTYCPMTRIKQKQSANPAAITNRPLLPCIVFVQVHPDSFQKLKRINGVLSIVHRLNNPAVVTGEEVMEIRKFLAHHDNVTIEKIPLSFSHSLYAAESPSIEQEGVNHFVILRLPSLGYQLKAAIINKPVVVQIPSRVEEFESMTALAAN